MKRHAVLMLSLTMLCSPTLRANEVENFGNLSANFYLMPTKEAFLELQQIGERLRPKLEAGGNRADLLVAVIVAKISQKHNWPIEDSPLGTVAKEIVAGTTDRAKYVADDSRVDATKLDIWWASFFATGDTAYLENIYKQALQVLPIGDIKWTTVVAPAQWSFKANCRQHKKVLEFAKHKLETSALTDAQRTYLKDCIAFGEPATSDTENAVP